MGIYPFVLKYIVLLAFFLFLSSETGLCIVCVRYETSNVTKLAMLYGCIVFVRREAGYVIGLYCVCTT